MDNYTDRERALVAFSVLINRSTHEPAESWDRWSEFVEGCCRISYGFSAEDREDEEAQRAWAWDHCQTIEHVSRWLGISDIKLVYDLVRPINEISMRPRPKPPLPGPDFQIFD